MPPLSKKRFEENDSYQWPDWDTIDKQMKKKEACKKFIVQDKGWRSNNQIHKDWAAKTRHAQRSTISLSGLLNLR